MDRSKEAMEFYEFLDANGAGDNLKVSSYSFGSGALVRVDLLLIGFLKRTALGFFPLPGSGDLRGVAALKSMKKGDVLIRIPYEVAINLGQEGDDPTLPAVALLEKYCRGKDDADIDRTAYFKMLPPFMGDDCLGSTDFFHNEALGALQAPLVVEETLKRRERTKSRFERDIALNEDFPSWIDGTPVTEEHLQWAVWLITSRVLTVQGAADENRSYRLLIPFLDMCNHDRTSPHVLTGRAVPGGELKVVAGGPVEAGDQINICYGGGVAGNDRFLQDYGFLDSDPAYNIVALQLLGKRRLVEGASAGRTISVVDREATLEQLHSTTMKEDEEELADTTDPSVKAALTYRLGVKKALSKYIAMK
jgi:hypothetical protein